MRTQFGNCWNLFGDPKYLEANAVVGDISGEEGLSIGLTAMQMRNIGSDYGPVSIENGGKLDRVKVYNAFGKSSLKGNKVWISKGVAEDLSLEVGSVIKLKRIMDKQGQIKYECENQKDNPFGQGWGQIARPAEAIIAAIDGDGYNSELYRVGLSAMQLDNLGIERRSAPLDGKKIVGVISASQRGLLDGQDYGTISISKGDKTESAQVYNAFGERSIGGCGIRVSSILAEDLGLNLEEKVIVG